MKSHASLASGRMLAALIVLVLWGLITHASYAGTGDEPHYMMMAYSLAFDHDLDLTGDYGNPGNRALSWVEAGDQVHAGKDGRLRPVHDVGLPCCSRRTTRWHTKRPRRSSTTFRSAGFDARASTSR